MRTRAREGCSCQSPSLAAEQSSHLRDDTRRCGGRMINDPLLHDVPTQLSQTQCRKPGTDMRAGVVERACSAGQGAVVGPSRHMLRMVTGAGADRVHDSYRNGDYSKSVTAWVVYRANRSGTVVLVLKEEPLA